MSLRCFGLRIVETLLVFASLLLALNAGVGQRMPWTPATIGQSGLIGALLLLTLYCFDVYEPRITTDQAHSVSRIIQAVGITMLVIAAIHYTWSWIQIDVPGVVAGLVLLGASLAISRYTFAKIVSRPEVSDRAVVWGAGPLAASIIHELHNRPDIGIRVVGVVEQAYPGTLFASVPYLGSPDVIWSLAQSGEASRIIVALNERRGSLPVERLMELKAAGLDIEDGAQLYEELTGKVWLGAFRVSSLLFSRRLRSTTIGLFFNRIFSVVFAIVSLVIASPVMLVTALLIRLDSEGPIILRQTRVGKNSRHFTLYKFRSMKLGAERASTLAPATEDDPRCTRVGKWIRRFRIDELPQLFNIVKGDMYFVGPRPFVPDQEASLVLQIPYYDQRWAVRPGATGWAQVHRDYCFSLEDNADKLSYDLFYIKNRSMGLDVVTLAKTLKILLLGRGGR
jgi:exopolysaccharide biosynthesis polyprenyl glycosylphosphotransferase